MTGGDIMCYSSCMKKKKWLRWLPVMAVCAAVFIWFFPALKSYAVMGVYSAMHHNTSVMRQNGFDIKMDAGKGWYPFVLTFNADGFSAWSGTAADMSILYNFGAFDASSRTSSLYDQSSPWYSAFYGAYVANKDGGAFGFDDDGLVDMQQIIQAVEYDYTQLVMRNFGCLGPVFSVEEYAVLEDTECAGSGGWTQIDALMRVNGVAHQYSTDKNAYLQYGRPPNHAGEDFPIIQMIGRLYVKYLDEYDCTVMLYAMAPDIHVVDACDSDIFSKTRIVPF